MSLRVYDPTRLKETAIDTFGEAVAHSFLDLLDSLSVELPTKERVNSAVDFGDDPFTGTLIFSREMKKAGANDLIDQVDEELRKK